MSSADASIQMQIWMSVSAFLLPAFSTKSTSKHLFAFVKTEILFCNIKKVARLRTTFPGFGAIYGRRYKKYRPWANNLTPFLDCSRLSEISRSGKTAEVKELIAKYGASKLSDIAESDYAAVFSEAEGLV